MGRSMCAHYTPVERYIDPRNTNILWYYIPGFNGYEISNTGIVRSMKHHRKYPFGILIKPREVKDPIELFTKNFIELTYELSDDYNERHIITRSELLSLAANNKIKVNGYPRLTIIADNSSRNPRCFKKYNKTNNNSLKEQIHQVEFCYEKNVNVQAGEQLNTNIIQPLIFNDGE